MAQATEAGPLMTMALSNVQALQARSPQAMLNFESLVVSARRIPASLSADDWQSDAQRRR
jgi:hypothetical protein